MKRYCQTLKLKNDPELIRNYVEIHDRVWPEIKQGFRDKGMGGLCSSISGMCKRGDACGKMEINGADFQTVKTLSASVWEKIA
jgi:phosphoribosylformylglycinamidine (FGAM) synthase-like enzyme